MKTCFLPTDYEQLLYQHYQEYKQWSRSIADYAEEFNRLVQEQD